MAKGNSKPQVYQGKTYPSIAALAKELNISALYLGLGIKKYPDDIEKAIEHCRAKMNGTGNTRNKKVVYKGVEYKSYSDLARNLLNMRSVDRFNAKRYELMKKGRSEEEAITEAIEYFENTTDTRKKDIEKPASLNHVERNVIIANTAKIIVDEIQSYLQKNKLDDHAKIYGFIQDMKDLKKITNQEKFLLYVAKVAIDELLRINKELNDYYLASIFVDTISYGTRPTNSIQWFCIIAHKDKWNVNDHENVRENDFNDTQREWIGGDTVRRDARRVNKARGGAKND
jgi:hypothetical protein